ncbi:MAG TPA: c-type cytochrome, partial [Bryobacteraceae bacterium]
MKPLLLLALCAFANAQNLAEVLKQGEAVFSKSCATGYCHGARGANGGAPRLAARGFDQDFIGVTVARGVPTTAMPAFAMTLSRSDLTAVVAYVASLNGVANPTIAGSRAPGPAPLRLSADAARGRVLFSEAVRSFGRCSTCHELAGIGIPVATP